MWATIIIITVLAAYIVSELVGTKLTEGFGTAIRSDIGDQEEIGWTRDLRYTATFANVQGLDIAGDFCRAVSKGNPDTLQIACALANRQGMDTLEYRSKSVGEGFRMSRDDYWKVTNGKSDYCRILNDDGLWFSSCAVSSRAGIGPKEFRDTEPPTYIKSLLGAYEGALTWYRWQDDKDDVTNKSAIEIHGSPIFPSMIKPIKTRGLQLNRSPDSDDFLVWGEKETLILDQDIKPNQIRAICCWVWIDTIEKAGSILNCSNGKEDLVRLGVESGGPYIPPAPLKVAQAIEVRPDHYLIQKKPTQESDCVGRDETGGSFSFEIWDKEQRLMRLRAPAVENQWQHVVVTTTDLTSWWPTWQIWIDGILIDEKKNGRAIPALSLKNNLIGKGLKGCIQDFRVYAKPMTPAKIKSAMAFAQPLLHPSP